MDMTEIKQFDERREGEAGREQPAVKLKLSEAIRIGARLRPRQCMRVYFEEDASCALGAAWEGAGFISRGAPPINTGELLRAFGIYKSFLGRDIADMNDSGESRESIADWLAAQGL